MSVELLGKSLSDLSIVTMIFRIILSMACGVDLYLKLTQF